MTDDNDPQPKRLGFFTRLLDEAVARRALSPRHRADPARGATRLRPAWVAQHHFRAAEGGLPSPSGVPRPRRRAHVAGSGSAPASSRCRSRTPCGWPRTRSCWTCSPAGASKSASAAAARRRPSPRSAWTAHTAPRSTTGISPSSDAWEATARRRRDALSGCAAAGRSRLAGDVLGRRRHPRRQAGDGLMLSRTQPRPKEPARIAGRDPAAHHRRLSRGAARGRRAADRRVALAVRRGQPE